MERSFAALPSVMRLLNFAQRENKKVELNEYTMYGMDIPSPFEGFRIAHVSDLHNAEFGVKNENLLALLQQATPDMIAITGDLIDARIPKEDIAADFVWEASQIAPVYYVAGNHEARLKNRSAVMEKLESAGARILDNEKQLIEREGYFLTVIGLSDPAFSDKNHVIVKLSQLMSGENGSTVLLSHRPEYFPQYASSGVGLVLCGHTHGGQFRIPGVGGLIAPGQGLIPKYDAGIYKQNRTSMMVSRGLGNSIIPLRINNRPELVILNLSTNKSG